MELSGKYDAMKTDINAGDFNKRITLQIKTVTRGNYGVETIVWSDVATIWAKVESLRGREYFEAQQIQNENYVRITIRFRKNITPELRVKYGSKYLDIQSVINIDEANNHIELMCIEATT